MHKLEGKTDSSSLGLAEKLEVKVMALQQQLRELKDKSENIGSTEPKVNPQTASAPAPVAAGLKSSSGTSTGGRGFSAGRSGGRGWVNGRGQGGFIMNPSSVATSGGESNSNDPFM